MTRPKYTSQLKKGTSKKHVWGLQTKGCLERRGNINAKQKFQVTKICYVNNCKVNI